MIPTSESIPLQNPEDLEKLQNLVHELTENADRTLREYQTMFKHLFESAPNANLLTDAEGHIIAVNQQTETILGYNQDELINTDLISLIPPKSRKNFHIFYATIFDDRVSRQQDLRLSIPVLCKDGQLLPVDISFSVLEINGTTRILFVFRDVVQRNYAENALIEQRNLIKLLQEIAMAANLANTFESPFQYALDRLCEFTGWPVGHVLLVQDNSTLVSADIWHLEDAERYSAIRDFSRKLKFDYGVGIPGLVLETKQSLSLVDVYTHPQFLRASVTKEVGLKSLFALPVLSGVNAVGVLEFFSTENISPSQSFLDILPNIGAQLGRVVERQIEKQKQKEQETLLRMVLETLPVGVWVTDQDGNILLGNEAGDRIWAVENYGKSEKDGDLKGWLASTGELISPRDWAVERVLKNGEASTNEEIIIECFDGSRKTILSSAFPLHDSNQTVNGAILVYQDITQRKLIEVELAEIQRRLLNSVEAERMRLAQDLHDGPIQDLYGVSYQLRELYDRLQIVENKRDLKEIQETIHKVISILRTTMGELRPPTLTPFGLEKAIRSHAERFQADYPEMDVHLDLMRDGLTLDDHVRLALYRNYQQFVSNVIRHATAKNVWIRLILEPDEIILEVQDDGLGFTPPQRWVELARRGNLGLVGASERAEVLGGKLEIISTPGEGAIIRTIIPRLNKANLIL